MGKVVTREWRKAKSAELEFAFVSAFRDNSSFGLNILGPLCLWQCLVPHGLETRWIVKCTGWIMNMSVAPDGKSVGDKSEFMQKPFRIYS